MQRLENNKELALHFFKKRIKVRYKIKLKYKTSFERLQFMNIRPVTFYILIKYSQKYEITTLKIPV